MKYKRILLKLSGEALSKGNGTSIEFDKVLEICSEIKDVVDKTGCQFAIVVGGGNFW